MIAMTSQEGCSGRMDELREKYGIYQAMEVLQAEVITVG